MVNSDLAFLLAVLCAWAFTYLAVYLTKRRGGLGWVEVSYGTILLVKSQQAIRIIDKIARALPIPLNIVNVVAIAGFSLILIAGLPFFPQIFVLGFRWIPSLLEILGRNLVLVINVYTGAIGRGEILQRGFQPLAPLIPGLTIGLSDIMYIVLAVGVGVLLHELAHGYVASRHGLPLKSAGILSFMHIFPGAFVEPDEEAFRRLRLKQKLSILGAGVVVNALIAVIIAFVSVLAAQVGTTGVNVEDLGTVHSVEFRKGLRLNFDNSSYYYAVQFVKHFMAPGQRIVLEVVRNGTKLYIPTTLALINGTPRIGVEIMPSETGYPEVVKVARGTPAEGAGLRPGDIIQKVVLGDDVVVSTPHKQLMLAVLTVSRISNGTVVLNVDGREVLLDVKDLAGRSVETNWVGKLLFWSYVVNVSLALVNAVPALPLDGGGFVLAVLNSVSRRDLTREFSVFSIFLWAVLALVIVFTFESGLYEIFRLLT